MVNIARSVLRDNGCSSATVVHGDCCSLSLPQRADVLVCEVFDCALLGEGALPILQHAWEHYLSPTATVVPAAATVPACHQAIDVPP